jgi:hypothetical protein
MYLSRLLDNIQAELRAKHGFLPKYFPFFHAAAETPSLSNGVVQHLVTRLDHLEQGRLMGVNLNANGVLMEDGSANLSQCSEARSAEHCL